MRINNNNWSSYFVTVGQAYKVGMEISLNLCKRALEGNEK